MAGELPSLAAVHLCLRWWGRLLWAVIAALASSSPRQISNYGQNAGSIVCRVPVLIVLITFQLLLRSDRDHWTWILSHFIQQSRRRLSRRQEIGTLQSSLLVGVNWFKGYQCQQMIYILAPKASKASFTFSIFVNLWKSRLSMLVQNVKFYFSATCFVLVCPW